IHHWHSAKWFGLIAESIRGSTQPSAVLLKAESIYSFSLPLSYIPFSLSLSLSLPLSLSLSLSLCLSSLSLIPPLPLSLPLSYIPSLSPSLSHISPSLSRSPL